MIQDNDTQKTFTGTPEEIVNQFHNSIHPIGQRDNDQEYMNSVADRIKVSCGDKIRTDNAENFINDVAEAGMWDILESN